MTLHDLLRAVARRRKRHPWEPWGDTYNSLSGDLRVLARNPPRLSKYYEAARYMKLPCVAAGGPTYREDCLAVYKLTEEGVPLEMAVQHLKLHGRGVGIRNIQQWCKNSWIPPLVGFLKRTLHSQSHKTCAGCGTTHRPHHLILFKGSLLCAECLNPEVDVNYDYAMLSPFQEIEGRYHRV